MNKLFKTTNPVSPGRSVFDLSYSKVFTGDMGYLYPVMCDELVPGDKFKIGNECVVRMMPLVAPILHPVNVYVHYFFVPYRLLWDDWETFITGGIDGEDASVLPRCTSAQVGGIGSLWDMFGFPPTILPTGAYPMLFPFNAYNLIWNEFYRDETNQDEVDLDDANLLLRSWEKDYFTSALPFQQRGISPSLPIAGTATAVWDPDYIKDSLTTTNVLYIDDDVPATGYVNGTSVAGTDNFRKFLQQNSIDLSDANTFNIADIRLAFQIQRWLERNARCGVRYTEFLHAHFGTSPRDDRLQRPEYVGGSMMPLVISETLQTSQTTTGTGASPQGNMAGHGIGVTQTFCGTYYAQEFGLIMGLMSIMPKPAYCQGINRQWLRRSKYDFYFPEFMHLSEQAIENAELYVTAVEEDNVDIFGYQGRYDEMRYKPNLIAGLMRTDFAHWHLARIFDSAPELNTTFLECVPDKRIFAVEDEPGFIISFGNLIKAIRPLPITGAPGLIDHV